MLAKFSPLNWKTLSSAKLHFPKLCQFFITHSLLNSVSHLKHSECRLLFHSEIDFTNSKASLSSTYCRLKADLVYSGVLWIHKVHSLKTALRPCTWSVLIWWFVYFAVSTFCFIVVLEHWVVLVFQKIGSFNQHDRKSPQNISPSFFTSTQKQFVQVISSVCSSNLQYRNISIILCETGFLTSLQAAPRALPP